MAMAKGESNGSVLLRTVLVVVAIFATVYMGALAGALLFSNDHWARYLSAYRPLLATSFLVLGIAMLGVSLPAVVRFIRCGWHHLLCRLRHVCPALVFLFLSALFAVSTSTPAVSVSEQVATLGIQFGHRGGAYDAVLVPFFEKVNPEASAGDCSPGHGSSGEASEIRNVKVNEAIEYLTKSLMACSKPQKQVVIDVQGFASTSAFDRCDKLPVAPGASSRSEQLNWNLAEERRRSVIRIVRRVNTKGLILIEREDANRWNGPQQMRARLRYDDTGDEGRYDPIKGALNRRVEIVIRSKGICEPDGELQHAGALK